MIEDRSNMLPVPVVEPKQSERSERGTCPLCKAVMMNPAAPSHDARWWNCTGCGQAWSAGRLLVVAAYAQYVTAQSPSTARRPS